MKKRGLLFLLIFLISIAIVNAQPISVTSEVLTEDVHAGEQIIFKLTIFNSDSSQSKFIISPDRNIGIFSEVVKEISFIPEFIPLDIFPGQKREVNVILQLREELDPRIDYAADIKIKSIDGSIQEKHRLVISLVPFDKVVKIDLKTPDEISPGKENIITIALKNRGPEFLEDLKVIIDGQFFQASDTIGLARFRTEEIDFNVRLDSDTEVGHYGLNVTVLDPKDIIVGEETFRYSVVPSADIKETLTTEKGLFSKNEIITKTNEGNSNVATFYKTELSTIQKLFTKTDPEPTQITRVEGGYEYEWIFELGPGESYGINIVTSYINLAIIIIALIVLLIILFIWLNSGVIVTKKVKIKDGVAQILLTVKNNGNIGMKNLKLIDHLPRVVHPSKHFGHIKPDEIHRTKLGTRLVWDITHLAKKEERIISYKLDHKVDLFGKIALPSAMVVYHHKGNEVRAHSNKANVEKKE